MADAKPSDPSSDVLAMQDYWGMVAAILGGTKAMRAAGQKYLPKFPMEDEQDYEFRRKNAKFTNVFRDIVENLAAKPFAQEVTVKEPSSLIEAFIEDVDACGSHVHVFASGVFFNGIANALDWILVDYTNGVPENVTRAQERTIGARPYWVRIPASHIIAVYTDMIEGQEQFVHVRVCEDTIERAGFAEVVKKRVRVMERLRAKDGSYGAAIWTLYELQQKENESEPQWVEIDAGSYSIGIIPLVPFLAGRRKGSSWEIVPPMQDAADLQIELFQQESGVKNAKESTAFPMLAGNGVNPSMGADGKPEAVPIGPKSVLYAPAMEQGRPGRWEFIEPNATSLKFLADDVKETINQIRELGRQPLTAQTGNLTVVTTAFAADKANSVIQAWAINLKDAIENALKITAMWLKDESEPEVTISTDFDLGLHDDKGPDTLLAMRAAGDLSQATLWSEMRRRSILSPEFDKDNEVDTLANEGPGDPTAEDLAAALVDPARNTPPQNAA